MNQPKWSKGATNALMNLITNQHRISLKRCLPEVTDFKCARLSRNFDGYKEVCLAFLWDHRTLNAKSEQNHNEHCVLIFNRKSRDLSTAAKTRAKTRAKKIWNFRTICFENLWNEWSEWTKCGRRSKVQKRRRTCNRQQFKDNLKKRERNLVRTKYLKCQTDSENVGKIQRRGCIPDKRPSNEIQKGPPGRWSGWSKWSMCSQTCDTGIKIRTRKCWSGKGECDGPDQVSLDCQTGNKCPQKIVGKSKAPHIIRQNCGPFLKGCGDGKCIKLLSGADYCQCDDDAIKNEDGTCLKNPEIDATLPTTEEDCRLWTFFLNGEELSKETCLRIVHDHGARQSFQIMVT